ncbi:hypothetical protein FE243_09535 [Aliarcobacter thereius]|uniref:rhamnan synthesis F family protein n=1 Tax=Aliarcobacter thereius TaxID=544718 RepID=UPI0010FD5204|nr:rhamnan synthesis F family protein [Aliarcobacter thereius]TLT05667.1 hypothetical protein FE243_09535 [Aliarcobacter thereius]
MNINPIKLYKYQKVYKTIKKSGLFDSKYYLFTYPDVRAQDIDPIKHYILYGAREGRNPSLSFDTKFYLDNYKDVKESGMNPLLHFIQYGKKEKRNPRKFDLIQEKTLLSFYINEFRQKESKETKKRLLIFSHYNKQNLLSDYVINILKEMNHLFTRVVFVSNSFIDKEDVKKLEPYCDKVLIRKNIGFDFGGWKEAILDEGFKSLSKYDSMTLMNDTCFGPLQDMTPIYHNMESREIDFWGLGNYNNFNEDLYNNFIVYNKELLNMNLFKKLWDELNFSNPKKFIDLINILLEGNYKFDTFRKLDSEFKKEPYFINIEKLINSSHPSFLKQKIHLNIYSLETHINDTYSPNISSKINNKNIVLYNKGNNIDFSIKIAIHIHVFYTDVLEKILSIIHLSNKVDIYITTIFEKKNAVELVLEKYNLQRFKKNIFCFENRGRNILPWLKINKFLEKYEIVGHFHTKKSNFYGEEWFGDSWMEEIIENMIVPFNNIINYMEMKKNIGIVIPEMPYFFKYLMKACPFDGSSGINRKNIQELWNNLSMKKNCDFSVLNTPIMSYGTMFWYRPKALETLTKYPFLDNQFQEEPLPRDGTLAHAIERLPVYVAWSEGYDYRVAITEKSISSGFDYKVNSLKK